MREGNESGKTTQVTVAERGKRESGVGRGSAGAALFVGVRTARPKSCSLQPTNTRAKRMMATLRTNFDTNRQRVLVLVRTMGAREKGGRAWITCVGLEKKTSRRRFICASREPCTDPRVLRQHHHAPGWNLLWQKLRCSPYSGPHDSCHPVVTYTGSSKHTQTAMLHMVVFDSLYGTAACGTIWRVATR